MKLVRLRLKSFRSLGPAATVIDLADLVFLLRPNGSGKTAVLQALARMFSLDPSQRKIRKSDFHVPKATVDSLTEKISSALAGNAAMVSVTQALTMAWEILHTGRHFTSPSVFFGRNEIEALLRHMSVVFTPGHDEASVDFSPP